jgi:hypothetical protein
VLFFALVNNARDAEARIVAGWGTNKMSKHTTNHSFRLAPHITPSIFITLLLLWPFISAVSAQVFFHHHEHQKSFFFSLVNAFFFVIYNLEWDAFIIF